MIFRRDKQLWGRTPAADAGSLTALARRAPAVVTRLWRDRHTVLQRRGAACALPLGLVAALAPGSVSCGGSDAGGSAPQPVARVVQLPDTARLLPGTDVAFQVFVVRPPTDSSPAPDGDVMWEATGGTIDGAGRYTAGSSTGAFRVVASYDAGRLRDTSAVIVEADAAIATVEVLPGEAVVLAGYDRELRAVVRTPGGGEVADAEVTWASADESVATVSAAGVVSGRRAGLVTISAAAGGRTGSTTLRVLEAGTFAPPDIASISFDDASQFPSLSIPGGPAFPSQTTGHTLDATGGRRGTAAMRIDMSNGSYEPLGPQWPPRSRVFVRYFFRATAGFKTASPAVHNVKGPRFHVNNGNLGVLKAEKLSWGFDEEAGGQQAATSMAWGFVPEADLAAGFAPTCENLADGNWHWIEIEYDRSAGNNVEVRFWCDGRAVMLPPGPAPFVTGMTYVAGDRAANVPATIRAERVGAAVISDVTLFETVSQGFQATIWIDDLAVSSQRIGP